MAYKKDVLKDSSGNILRPCTVSDNVINPTSRKSLTEELGEIERFKVHEIEAVSSSLYYPFSFKKGDSYIIRNIGSTIVTLYTRLKLGDSSSTVDVVSSNGLKADSEIVFTATSDASYLFLGTLGKIRIQPIDSNAILAKEVDSLGYAAYKKIMIPFSSSGMTYQFQGGKIVSVASNNWQCAKSKVYKGERIKLNVSGGNNALAYIIIGNNGAVVQESQKAAQPKTVFVEQDGVMYVNNLTNDFPNPEFCICSSHFSTIEGRIEDVFDTNGGNFLFHWEVGACYDIIIDCNVATRVATASSLTDTAGIENVNPTGGSDIYYMGGNETMRFKPKKPAEYIRIAGAAGRHIVVVRRVFGEELHEKNAPEVKFAYDHNMYDVSADINGFNNLSTRNGCNTTIEQVYAKFDSLVEEHHDYISRLDAAEEVGLTYPEYARLGGSANGKYQATPTYKTYMYKLSESVPYLTSGNRRRKRMLIIGGTHGNELAATINLYLFAKYLAESKDENYFKLRSIFDIYIIPCLNGYGMYHTIRTNADGININRNYPIKNWVEDGDGTDNYTGKTGGSTFEAKLVMEITKMYGFDVAIDHHNYANIKQQFYSEVNNQNALNLSYQSFVDCCIAFIKNLPGYFGRKFRLFKDASMSSAPSHLSSTYSGTTNRWWNEYGVEFACTIEISQCINYNQGEPHEGTLNNFGSDTFSVGEYTLRNQVMRYAESVLG